MITNQLDIILACYIIIFVLVISTQINDSIHDYIKSLYQKKQPNYFRA